MREERLHLFGRDLPLHLTVYESGAKSPSVVFVPGMSTHAGFYATMIPGENFLEALARQGFNVVCLDLRGHGLSGGARGDFTFRGVLEDIGDAARYAKRRWGPRVGVTGSSMGGILAFYAGLLVPEIRCAACHNVVDLARIAEIRGAGAARFLRAAGAALRGVARVAPRLPVSLRLVLDPREVFSDPENIRRWKREPRIQKSYTLAAIASLFLTPEEKPPVEAMRKPTFVAVGAEEAIIPVEHQKRFFERLRCPKELLLVPGAAHMLPLEHRDRYLPPLARWLHAQLG